jgi:hypothetical protein
MPLSQMVTRAPGSFHRLNLIRASEIAADAIIQSRDPKLSRNEDPQSRSVHNGDSCTTWRNGLL